MFDDVKKIRDFYFYEYHFLDDLSFLRAPSDVISEGASAWCEAIAAELKKRGWEGDGKLSIMWLPPFVGAGVEGTWGTYVWVVKQSNNGTAFLASPDELPFLRLLEQNRSTRVYGDGYPESIARMSREGLEDGVQRELKSLDEDLTECAPNSRTWGRVLEHSEAQLIVDLHEFLDDGYLAVLQEVVLHGNRSKLKLRKIGVDMSPGGHVPDDEDVSDAHEFFTLTGLVSDTWRTYKFLNFPQKADHLFSALGFKPDEKSYAVIRKHVEIRNLFQHNQGVLTRETLKRLGIKRLDIATDAGAATAQEWKRVVLHPKELRLLGEAMVMLSRAIDAHCEKTIVGRWYSSRKPDSGGPSPP